MALTRGERMANAAQARLRRQQPYVRPMPLRKPSRAKIPASALLFTVVTAHIFMWLSPDMPLDAKIRLTTLNALGWASVVLLAWGVSLWLKAQVRRNAPRRGDHID